MHQNDGMGNRVLGSSAAPNQEKGEKPSNNATIAKKGTKPQTNPKLKYTATKTPEIPPQERYD